MWPPLHISAPKGHFVRQACLKTLSPYTPTRSSPTGPFLYFILTLIIRSIFFLLIFFNMWSLTPIQTVCSMKAEAQTIIPGTATSLDAAWLNTPQVNQGTCGQNDLLWKGFCDKTHSELSLGGLGSTPFKVVGTEKQKTSSPVHTHPPPHTSPHTHTSLGYWRYPRARLLPPGGAPNEVRGGIRDHAVPSSWRKEDSPGVSWSSVPPQLWPSLPSPLALTPGFLPSPPSIGMAFSHTLSPHLLTLKLAWSLWRFLPRGLMTGDAAR